MLTRRVRLQVVVFVLLALAGVTYVGARYAGVERLLGTGGYLVHAEFPDTGGVFSGAEVTYNGVPVGRVGDLRLTDAGVEVDLRLDDGSPPVPADVEAVVTDRSAVGEQYVDLRPRSAGAPYLHDGSVIARPSTALPPSSNDLVVNLDRLVNSVPRDDLRTVVDELYLATQDTGPGLQALLDATSGFTQAAADHLPQTLDLITDGNTVLATQLASSDAIKRFGENAKLIASTLDSSAGDVRTILSSAAPAAQQISALLHETGPNLTSLLANLLTTSQVLLDHRNGVEQLLVVAPEAVDLGGRVITGDTAGFGLVTTFFDPLPCTAGYEGTPYRDGLDTAPVPLNTGAGCRR
ncbi:phospholipid/cholesterol/gamma-HCH transport system substrate-binding protein [Amycolatopsis bartoniae]|uniref:ABC transporter substrate-binding protein n=1 Tax=Amycolatopsis bartoniae TaxID=941986 RepID=A0A8H9ISD2_9PSEU|nr:MlaD family protein [Amycolatopsis bartoniae]MBB2937150.1 phospholipid/cholesterol/gamma-HCH transport system substrate-binding protein [Amycolatopsis bartoniae]TVT06023.1 MCE family protein [Amycolatopsis bartoniae]GHF52804.1 ABC transporter substrate-binding protein [Amycolatopsis bartoniae]